MKACVYNMICQSTIKTTIITITMLNIMKTTIDVSYEFQIEKQSNK